MATLSVPSPLPSAAEDAEKLHKAFQGWGTDEKAVIEVLAHRNAEQRRQIARAYEERFEETLTRRLEAELSGAFEKAVYRWMFPPTEREAVFAAVAVRKGKPVDYRVIVETACISSPDELLAVKHAYLPRHKRCLEEDLASACTGDLRRFLHALVGTHRYGGHEVDAALAKAEARVLHDAVRDGAFHHEEVVRVLTTRSRAQLNATFNRYKDDFGASITKGLTAAGPQNDLAVALRVAVKCTVSPHKYFEKVLRNAVSKSDEDDLTRVVVTRSEKDLRDIKAMFFKRTSVTLEQAVGKATSGDYKAFLLALIGD